MHERPFKINDLYFIESQKNISVHKNWENVGNMSANIDQVISVIVPPVPATVLPVNWPVNEPIVNLTVP